ncbi:MAG: peptidoglycan DD-metalloendopeptidase family protein [Clostridiaceae bacterium]|nr:peptidoglycan DD-metalloendopeptidase family protein [Clostridiaceae bacterium]
MRKKRGEQSHMIKRVSYLIVALILVVVFMTQSFANQLSEYEKQKQEKDSNIKKVSSQIQEKKADLNWNKKKRDEVIKELENIGLKKEEVEQRIQLLESAIQSLDEAILIAEDEYARQEEMLKERLRIMHKRTVTIWDLDELFKCKNLNELFIKIRYMQLLSDEDQRLLDSLERKRIEIEQLKEQKALEVENCIEQANLYAQKIEELEVSRSSLENRIYADDKEIKKYEKMMDQMLKESKELEQLIKNMKTMGAEYIGGTMVWPMPTNKHIASGYGNRLHPIYKVWKMHTGIDIGSAMNEQIVAAADGVVIYAGSRSGYGNTIIIDHGGGITTLYAHIVNRGFNVKTGQYVKAEQAIAKAGMTGTATGPHLHFEVRVNGAPQNPLKYVKP